MLNNIFVMVVADREEYKIHGIHKGDKGYLCDNIRRGSKWLVKFPQFNSAEKYKEVYIDDDDLGCLFYQE